MRMRRKPWAERELAQSPFFTDKPVAFYGKWNDHFARRQPVHLELGCGKGGFLCQIAPENPGINYIGVDIKDAVLGQAVKNARLAYEARSLAVDNLWLTAWDISHIREMLGPGDGVERIYINFCNPWPRGKHHKKRLTHPRQLMQYASFMPAGELWFKTDDGPLFSDTLEYLAACGLGIRYLAQDLHASGFSPNYLTEHERMYLADGKQIRFLIASFPGKVPEADQRMSSTQDIFA